MKTNKQIDIYNILQEGKIFYFKDRDAWYNDVNFPENGIYLMLEKTEKKRISRIGINGAGELRNRLNKHLRGQIRNSVFRRHLYKILGSEEEVSNYIKDNVSFYIIADPEDRRVDLESKLIPYFSFPPVKVISNNWLGLKSNTETISSSGLWNVHHVHGLQELTSDDLCYIEKNLIR